MKNRMSDIIKLVNAGIFVYKFDKDGSVFTGLDEKSFSKKELNGKPFGYVSVKPTWAKADCLFR